ncbi:hypothetical protein [Chryseobacterium sp. 2R14A]|uniref:hypothetical protein n=1 Tax=Chryseobacterium sp. 2R14A TaxID=3380353 RepID=UPI003CF0FBCD
MAIPEFEDQVIANFVHQHPDQPFVMGGMLHGGVGGNNIKSLSSKSGNIICLNDSAGIEIKDRNKNHFTLSGTGDVTTFISNNNNKEAMMQMGSQFVMGVITGVTAGTSVIAVGVTGALTLALYTPSEAFGDTDFGSIMKEQQVQFLPWEVMLFRPGRELWLPKLPVVRLPKLAEQ